MASHLVNSEKDRIETQNTIEGKRSEKADGVTSLDPDRALAAKMMKLLGEAQTRFLPLWSLRQRGRAWTWVSRAGGVGIVSDK